MKKTFTLILLLLSTATVWSQHLTFKGIELNGSVKAFSAQLQKKGYEYIGTTNGIAMLSGAFANFQNCTIGLLGNEAGTIVKAAVIFPNESTWGKLEDTYLTLKSLLIQKYGEPTITLEEFKNNYSTELDDYMKLSQIGNDEILYGCAWELPNGTIELRLDGDISGYYPVLSYIDADNRQQSIEQALEDL